MREKIKSIFTKLKNATASPKRRAAIIAAVLSCVLIFSTTYAWYTHKVSNNGSQFNTGTLSFNAYGYDATGSNGFIVSEDPKDANGNYTDGSIGGIDSNTLFSIENASAGQVYTSYLSIENTGSIDLDYYFAFTIAGASREDYLTGFWYRFTEVTDNVNKATASAGGTKLQAYANTVLPINCTVSGCANGVHVCTESEGDTPDILSLSQTEAISTLKVADTRYYRLDIGLRSTSIDKVYSSGQFSINAKIEATQVGAWANAGGENEFFVSKYEDFEKSLREALPGDTITLLSDIVYEKDIVLNKSVSIYTGSHTLTVRGNLIYNFQSSVPLNIDTSGGGSIEILTKEIKDSETGAVLAISGGNFTITAPNAAVNFIGAAANKDIIVARNINVQASYEKGWTLTGVSMVEAETRKFPKAVTIGSNTKIEVGSGVALESIGTPVGAVNIKIINHGVVNSVSLANMRENVGQVGPQIYIQNHQTIGKTQDSSTGASNVIMLPQSWPVKYDESTGKGNTYIIQKIGANEMHVTNADKFTDADIIVEKMTTFVEPIKEGDYTVLRVYLMNRGDNKEWPLQAVLDEYFTNLKEELGSATPSVNINVEESINNIKKLEIVTVGSKLVNADDFNYMHRLPVKNGDTIIYEEHLKSLEEIDFTRANIENNTIPDSAFEGKISLKKVVLSNNVLTIGKRAFYGTSMKSITVPASVTELGDECFALGSYAYFKSYDPPKISSASNLSCRFVFVHENAYNAYTKDQKVNGVQQNKWYDKSDYIYVNAIEADDGDNFVRELQDGSYELALYVGQEIAQTVGSGIELNGDLITVTKVGAKAYIHAKNYVGSEFTVANNYLQDVVFCDTIKEIGNRAFYKLAIKTVVFSDSVDIINSYAFSETSITTLNTNNVSEIMSYAFTFCNKLTSAEMPGIKTVGYEAFSNCPALATTRFGPQFVSCESRAFVGSNVKEIYLTNVVSSSGEMSIANVRGRLAECRVFVPYSRISVYSGIFGANTAVAGERIGDYVLYDYGNGTYMLSCYMGTDIKENNYTIPDTIDGKRIVSLGNGAYAFTVFENAVLTFPNSIKEIGNYAFNSRSGVTGELNLNTVETVGSYAFYGTGITEITAPNLKNIAFFGFASCTKLENAMLPKVALLGDGCFNNCSALRSVYFEEAVRLGSGNNSFVNCSNMVSITINKLLGENDSPNLGGFAIKNVKLIVPYNQMDYYKVTQYNRFKIFEIVPFGEAYTYDSSVYYLNEIDNNGVKEYEMIALNTNATTLTIPAQYNGYKITKIAVSAFGSAHKITQITLPRYYEHYVDGVFDTLTDITTINVDSNNQYFTASNGVLYTKNYEELVYYPSAKVGTGYSVHASTVVVRAGAFTNAKTLSEVTFGANLKMISSNSFEGASYITKVTFLGTTPPYMGSSMIFNPTALTIVVPVGAKAAYTSAYGFIEYKNCIIEA